MKHSEQINELVTAMAKAQAEMNNPIFDAANPYFRSKYASLAQVRNAVIPLTAKHGIFWAQELRDSYRIVDKVWYDKDKNEVGRAENVKEYGTEVTNYLFHSSGQWMEFDPWFMPSRFESQGLSSGGTYGKRTSMQAIAGVVGDDDDDANEATHPNGPPKSREVKLPQKQTSEELAVIAKEWQEKLSEAASGDDAAAIWKDMPAEVKKMPETVKIKDEVKHRLAAGG